MRDDSSYDDGDTKRLKLDDIDDDRADVGVKENLRKFE